MSDVAIERIFFADEFETNYEYEGKLVDIDHAWRMATRGIPANADVSHILESINILAQSGCFRVVIEPAAGDKIVFYAKKLIKVYYSERKKNRILELSSVKGQKIIHDSLRNIYSIGTQDSSSIKKPDHNQISLSFQGNLGGKGRSIKYVYGKAGVNHSVAMEYKNIGTKTYAFGVIGAFIFVWQAFITGAIQALASALVGFFVRF